MKQDFGITTSETHPTTPCADKDCGTTATTLLSDQTTGDPGSVRVAKHTPGPWLVENTTVYFLDWDGESYEGKGISYRQQLTNRFSCSMQGQEKRIPRAELLANANLIAAAPEMLAALEKARVAIALWSPCPTEPLEEINAAISRALGTEHDAHGNQDLQAPKVKP